MPNEPPHRGDRIPRRIARSYLCTAESFPVHAYDCHCAGCQDKRLDDLCRLFQLQCLTGKIGGEMQQNSCESTSLVVVIDPHDEEGLGEHGEKVGSQGRNVLEKPVLVRTGQKTSGTCQRLHRAPATSPATSPLNLLLRLSRPYPRHASSSGSGPKMSSQKTNTRGLSRKFSSRANQPEDPPVRMENAAPAIADTGIPKRMTGHHSGWMRRKLYARSQKSMMKERSPVA